jgi:hypothetical protein
LTRGREHIMFLSNLEVSPILSGLSESTSSKEEPILLKAGSNMDNSFGVHCRSLWVLKDLRGWYRKYLAVLYAAKSFCEVRKTSQNFAEFDQYLRRTVKNFLNGINPILQNPGECQPAD